MKKLQSIFFFIFYLFFFNITFAIEVSFFNPSEIRDFSVITASLETNEFKIYGFRGGIITINKTNQAMNYLTNNLFNITVIRQFDDSNIYIGTNKHGLFKYNLYSNELIQSDFLNDVTINDISIYKEFLYVGTEKGIIKVNKNSLAVEDFIINAYNKTNPIADLLLINKDTLWVKNDSTAIKINMNTFLNYSNNWDSVSLTTIQFNDRNPLAKDDFERQSKYWWYNILDINVFNNTIYIGSSNSNEDLWHSLLNFNPSNKNLAVLGPNILKDKQITQLSKTSSYLWAATEENGLIKVNQDNVISILENNYFVSKRVNHIDVINDTLLVLTLRPQQANGGQDLFFEGGVAFFNPKKNFSFVYTTDTTNVIDNKSFTYNKNRFGSPYFKLLSSTQFPASWWEELYYSFYIKNKYLIILSVAGNLYLYNTNSTLNNINDDSLLSKENLQVGIFKKIIKRNSEIYLLSLKELIKISINNGVIQKKFFQLDNISDNITDFTFINDTLAFFTSQKELFLIKLKEEQFQLIKKLSKIDNLNFSTLKRISLFSNKLILAGDEFLDIINFHINDFDSTNMQKISSTIFPNPLYKNQTNKLFIKDLYKNDECRIYTSSGFLVKNIEFKENYAIYTLDINSLKLESGIYIFIIKRNNKAKKIKVLIL